MVIEDIVQMNVEKNYILKKFLTKEKKILKTEH